MAGGRYAEEVGTSETVTKPTIDRSETDGAIIKRRHERLRSSCTSGSRARAGIPYLLTRNG